MALIENIQRENLNPIDEALAYRRLADEFQLTQEDIAAAVGKDRASVANYLRLLKLPDEVRDEVGVGPAVDGPRPRAAGSRRARPTSAARGARRHRPQPVGARNRVAGEEDRRRRGAARRRPTPAPADVHTRAAEERLRLLLGTRVRIVRTGRGGRIEIDFGSEDELIRIYEQLTDEGG